MYQLSLSIEEKQRLSTLHRTLKSRVSERCQFILLNASGVSIPEISKRMNRNEHTVRKWIKSYETNGIEGLEDTPQPGRPASQTQAVEQHLESLVSSSPESLGYQESAWSVELLLHALEAKGVHVSDSTVRHALKNNGWVYKRFRKQVPEHAPSFSKKKERVEQIVKTLEEQQKKSDQPIELLFEDESHFTNQPYVQRGWCRKGVQKQVPQPKKRETRTIFGAFHLKTQKCYWKQAEKGNSKTFIEFLHQLHQRFPQALIVLILDNGKIHKSHKVQNFVKKHCWIQLELLLPYSPEFNPIERFWLWLKKKVYGQSAFEKIEQLIQKIRRILWHYNEGWLTTTIQFRFELYQSIL